MRNNILIIAVTMIDFVTAMLVLVNKHALLVARLGIFYKIFPEPYTYIGAFLMLIAVVSTICGLTLQSRMLRFIFFIPQQIFLIMTTGSVIDFVILGHYADGVARSWEFILQDQLPTIFLTLGYFFSILDFERKKAL